MASPSIPTHPIVDSHIHLFAASDLHNLTWTGELAHDHILNRGYTVSDYRSANGNHPKLRGFVFVETDRKSGLEQDQWDNAIAEIEFLASIATGKHSGGGKDEADEQKLVLGVVPWAPVAAGPAALQKYIDRALDAFPKDKRYLIKGFRYLLQDKPARTMLQPDFVESLIWLGEKGFSFDLGVDARSVGLHMLDEACELLERIYSQYHKPKIIINHFCKPNLRLSKFEAENGHPEFTRWKACIQKIATFENTYMKLSGFFSELPQQSESDPADIAVLVDHVQPWVDVVFQSFTPSRIMFGSDWPVCNMGGPGTDKSWAHWVGLVAVVLAKQNLDEKDKAMVWAGTAIKAYNIHSATEN